MPVKDTPKAGVEEFFESASEAPQGASLNGHAPNFEPPNPMDAGELISIDIGPNHLPTMTSLCWEAIKKGNKPPTLFLHGTQMIRAARHPDTGKAWLQHVTPEILRHELARWAHWHKNQFRLMKPPLDVVRDVLATKQMPLPVLRRVVSVPVFGRTGALLTTPGYCEESGVLFVPDEGFEALPVPDPVTPEHVEAANQLLCGDVLIDFPFASTADRDNAVSLFLLPYARDLIDGPTPCHLLEAPMPSSGKSLLGELLMYPYVREEIGLISAPTKEEEWEKQITTVLKNVNPVVLIDNVTSMINSGSLASALTGRVWDKRLLGGHESANVPIKCVWIMTANNVALSTELATRQVRSRIAPQTDRPEERTQFKHPEIRSWVAEHRAELVQAAHVLIRWWLQQGAPTPKAKPHSRYPTWSRVMGGVLEACGYADFLGNYRDFQGRADTSRLVRSNFCSTWYNWVQRDLQKRQHVTATELAPIAEGVEGFPLNGDTLRKQAISLGKWLTGNIDAIVEHTEDDDNGVPVKRVFRVEKWPTLVDGRQHWMISRVE